VDFMALERYRQKRDFRVTPEPAGKVGARRSKALSFVVQKHAATRLHFDFRLELNGVLLSWAVPKGPSLDPNDKRLAMHVEDHPLEYGEFEGVIPPKQYGAGTVMVWDRGTWTPKGDAEQAYAKGHLKFELHGDKLRGGWNLVKSRSGKYGGDSWLLIKEADDYARLGAEGLVTEDQPESVLTGRSMDEIKARADRVWHSNRSVKENVKGGAIRKRTARLANAVAKLDGAQKAAMPEKLAPQLATLVKTPPSGPQWVHEIKYDGYRMLCRIEDGAASLISRTGKDWTADFPTLVRDLARLPVDTAWLDGEVVVLDEKGRTSFQALQNALSGTVPSTLAYIAFDLLYLDGVDLRGAKLTERKAALEKLVDGGPASVRYSEHFAVPGDAFHANVAALGLEGMVSKRADLRHAPGRGPAWQKLKVAQRESFYIGGFTDPEGSRQGFGALLLGTREPDGTLAYCGRVGTGFNDATLVSLKRTLEPLARSKPPFRNPPTGYEARGVHWVEPTLVAEVSFGERTHDGTLRHPSFLGLRDPKDVAPDAADAAPPSRRASAADAKNTIAGVTLTNPDKLLYADAKLSKRDLAQYYATVGEWMLPHLAGRPLTLVRCPNGWDSKCFYQKKADESVPAALTRVRIADGSIYMTAESVTAIVTLLQMGVLEIHPWGSQASRLDRPDRIVLDLDPDEGLPWADVKQAVLLVKALLENLELAPYLKSTGGKGLHVVVPLEPRAGWDDVKGFTKAVAELLERTFPDRFTSKLLKVSRGGRIFIDYLRNAEGATAVAAYSLRAKAGAPVSTPLAWSELGKDIRFGHFNARNVPKRLSKLESDPWKGLAANARPLTSAVMARVGYKPGRGA
jgi:bifunctional non-homologous end joining protein LigD